MLKTLTLANEKEQNLTYSPFNRPLAVIAYSQNADFFNTSGLFLMRSHE